MSHDLILPSLDSARDDKIFEFLPKKKNILTDYKSVFDKESKNFKILFKEKI